MEDDNILNEKAVTAPQNVVEFSVMSKLGEDDISSPEFAEESVSTTGFESVQEQVAISQENSGSVEVDCLSEETAEFIDVCDFLNKIIENQIMISKNIRNDLKDIAQKDEMIQNLHNDLQFRKKGLHLQMLRPFLSDLTRLYDALEKRRTYYAKQVDENTDKSISEFANELENYLVELEEVFLRNGFELYNSVGDKLNSSRHFVANIIETDNPKLHQHVAESLRSGIIYICEDGSTLSFRPERVIVYRYVGFSEVENTLEKDETSS